MSILVVLLPSRKRSGARPAGEPAEPATEYAYVLSADGLNVARQGRATPVLLPKADTVIAWVAATEISWHRIDLPRAPAAKLRAALVGVLEEQLLDDEAAVHLAVAPEASGGSKTWVAAIHKRWLADHLERLEKAGAFVERVVPASWPGDVPLGHFFTASEAADGSSAQTWVAFSDGDGVRCIRLAGTLVRDQLRVWARQGARWSTAPAVAAQAERWVGAPVAVQPDAEHALQAVRSLWNLRQFDLSARARGSRLARDSWKRFLSPAWRPVRIGLAALLALHVIGINLWAWQQRSEIEQKKQAMVSLLRASHPQIGTIVDAPIQMRRATDNLRAAAGRVGDTDLESALAVAAQAWPDGQTPAQTLRFESGKLTLTTGAWSGDQVERFRSRLRTAGWTADFADGRLVLSRREAGGSLL